MRLLPTLGIFLLALSAACSGAASTPTAAPSSDVASDAAPALTATATPAATPTSVPAPPPPPTPAPLTLAPGWTVEEIDRGIKPALALDSAAVPHIAFMAEDRKGYVKYAQRREGQWQLTTVSEGYFYGPLDIAIGPDDVPHIIYHNHQDLIQFQPDKGDLAYAVLRGGQWQLEEVFDAGHDGWDGRLLIGPDNLPQVSAIDPLDFGGGGVEYYELTSNGVWSVEPVGSPPVTYKYATSIALDALNNPHIAYHSGREGLQLASRLGDEWAIETVDGEFRTGLFSSLAIDGSDAFHISYVRKSGPSAGEVRYAFRSSPGQPWQITTLDTLEEVLYGTGNGARNITSLVLDSDGNPWIAYSDESVIKLAVWTGSEWKTDVVAASGDKSLGQLVSLKLDAQDTPHLAFFVATSKLPLDGVVMYGTRRP